MIEFMSGGVDVRRVGDLALALSLMTMNGSQSVHRSPKKGRRRSILIPTAYAAMKLTILPRDLQVDGDLVSIEEPARVAAESGLIPLLRAGRVGEAYALASRRLKASTGLNVKSDSPQIADGRENGIRLAAALLFPVSEASDSILADAALRPNKKPNGVEEENQEGE